MSAAELVFSDGDRIHGWGRFVVDNDGQWFDLSHVVPLGMSRSPRPRSRRYSVPLLGSVDVEAVPTGFGPRGAVPGHLTLTGVWEGSALRVEQQSPARPAEFEPPQANWTAPPCPPPAGGWPRGMTANELEQVTSGVDDLRASGAAVTVVWFHPGPGQAVLVVAATDPGLVRQVLAPQLPGRLCVVASRWTRARLDAVYDTLRTHRQTWTVEVSGAHIDDGAQESAMASPMRVPDSLARWADSLPPGLLTLHPALRPVHPHAP